eukprot:TRINITY_DN5685_c0_g1_i5.p1 TRINITY_DN5685_c0_g1~~TRINITY_DN5685_c0_g1_i5.p1  ORF type:complete len:258 (-),score=41.72 TRINITY_DN5685_c0_g1_i5:92-865(-)
MQTQLELTLINYKRMQENEQEAMLSTASKDKQIELLESKMKAREIAIDQLQFNIEALMQKLKEARSQLNEAQLNIATLKHGTIQRLRSDIREKSKTIDSLRDYISNSRTEQLNSMAQLRKLPSIGIKHKVIKNLYSGNCTEFTIDTKVRRNANHKKTNTEVIPKYQSDYCQKLENYHKATKQGDYGNDNLNVKEVFENVRVPKAYRRHRHSKSKVSCTGNELNQRLNLSEYSGELELSVQEIVKKGLRINKCNPFYY